MIWAARERELALISRNFYYSLLLIFRCLAPSPVSAWDRAIRWEMLLNVECLIFNDTFRNFACRTFHRTPARASHRQFSLSRSTISREPVSVIHQNNCDNPSQASLAQQAGEKSKMKKDFLICSSLDSNSSAIETSGGFVCSVVQMQSYSDASWSGGGFLIGPRHSSAHFGILNNQLAKAARNFVLDSAIKLIPWKCGKDFFLALLNLHKAKAGALKLTFHSKTSRASSWQIPDFSAIILRKIKIKI